MSPGCISLRDSSACPAFSNATISTSNDLVSRYSFLAYVRTVSDFDDQLDKYVKTDYVKMKFQDVLGCSNIDLSDTAALYARYTASVLCSDIIHDSLNSCENTHPAPLCADSCAHFGESQVDIVEKNCENPVHDYMSQVMADFTTCSISKDSLDASCVSGATNEPDNCGFGANSDAFCSYCNVTTDLSPTKSPIANPCCVAANAVDQCQSSQEPLSSHAMSGGAIAGLVIGSVIAGVLIVFIIIVMMIRMHLRKMAIIPQTAPFAGGPPRSYFRNATLRPNSRVSPSCPPPSNATSSDVEAGKGTEGTTVRPEGEKNSYYEHSGDDNTTNWDDQTRKNSKTSPGTGTAGSHSQPRSASSATPPSTASRRDDGNFSVSSAHFRAESPTATVPDGTKLDPFASSRRIASASDDRPSCMEVRYFQDFYSDGNMKRQAQVAVLFAYTPRAEDEFGLKRGDMYEVFHLWSDGWAVGRRLDFTIDQWVAPEPGLSASTPAQQEADGNSDWEIPFNDENFDSSELKAFPLVCCCLPQHWKANTKRYEAFPNIRPLMDSRDGQASDPPVQVFEELISNKTPDDIGGTQSSEQGPRQE